MIEPFPRCRELERPSSTYEMISMLSANAWGSRARLHAILVDDQEIAELV